MSLVHIPPTLRGHPPDQQSTVQKLLDENSRLIDIISEFQNQGRADDAIKHQQLLHRNLIHLSNLAEPSLLSQLREDGQQTPSSQQAVVQEGLAPPPQPAIGYATSASPSQPQIYQAHQPMHQNGPPPPGTVAHQEFMQHYQRQQQGYPPFGQPGPQMGMPPGRMPPGYPYGPPPGPYPPQGFEGHPGYPHPGQLPPPHGAPPGAAQQPPR